MAVNEVALEGDSDMAGLKIKLNVLTWMLILIGLVSFTTFLSKAVESAPASNVSSDNPTYEYEQFIPEAATDVNKRHLYWLNEKFCVYVGPHDESQNTRQGRVKTLYLAEQGEKGLVIKYRSSGSGDAYNLTPFFYKSHGNDIPIIILGEYGAEYSWGIRVFLFDGTSITDIGYLPITGETHSGRISFEGSAIPYTKIHKNGDSIYFSFSKDVFYRIGFESKLMPKEQIQFIYKDGSLKPAIQNYATDDKVEGVTGTGPLTQR